MKLGPINIHPNCLKPFNLPEGFVLVRDTREQRPLFNHPQDGLEVVTDTLHYGDYSIRGFEEMFTVERKQISDFYSFIGKERVRTVKKMEQFREIVSCGGFVGLVIEASECDLLSGYIMSRVSPEVARQALVSFEIRYGVHCYYSKYRKNIERWIIDRAVKFYRIMRECKRGIKAN
jgi:ERCC4-type nuclease